MEEGEREGNLENLDAQWTWKKKKKKSNSLHFINAISLYLSLFVLHSSEETEVHKNIQQVAQ